MSDNKEIINEIECIYCSQPCLEIVQNSFVSILCEHCGYGTNSEYALNSERFINTLNNSPQIISKLQIYDENRELIWIPTVIITQHGAIFPEPDLEKEWHWAVNRIYKSGDTVVADMDNITIFEKIEFKKAVLKLEEIFKNGSELSKTSQKEYSIRKGNEQSETSGGNDCSV